MHWFKPGRGRDPSLPDELTDATARLEAEAERVARKHDELESFATSWHDSATTRRG